MKTEEKLNKLVYGLELLEAGAENEGLTPTECEKVRILIASSPELLEALEGMLEWARRVKVLNPGHEIGNAHNAIRKAEGL